MSRGPGRMMRRVLTYLAERLTDSDWCSYYVIAWVITRREITERTGTEPPARNVTVSASKRESVRRAIKTLEAAGRVETCRRWYWERDLRDWNGLHCRLSPSERERLTVGESPTLTTPAEAGEAVERLQQVFGGRS